MKDMMDIIKWLRGIEHMATEVYLHAASVFRDDPKLKKFLERTAEDEAYHYHVMGSAADFLKSTTVSTPAIAIDIETSDKITKYFSDIMIGLKQNSISRDRLIENIVEVELSEWNDIFLYVVNVLKEKTSEFKYPAARMQAHIKGIEYFLETTENRPDALQKITTLPPIWVEKILIIDDEEIITDLIKSILNRTGNIDVVHNGRDALELITGNYYKLIISDIDMPIVDGITLFKEATLKYPKIKNRYLFLTGLLTAEREAFFKENHINYLAKPASINVLRKTALNIILSN